MKRGNWNGCWRLFNWLGGWFFDTVDVVFFLLRALGRRKRIMEQRSVNLKELPDVLIVLVCHNA